MQIEVTEDEFAALRSLLQKAGVAIAEPLPVKQNGWGSKRDAARLLGCSVSGIDRLCKSGDLVEGIHWYKKKGGKSAPVLLYLPLLKDWAANRYDPQAHQKAINDYVRSLPSNKSGKKS